jgi:protein SCO1
VTRRIPIFLFILMASCTPAERSLPYYDSADFTPRWELPEGAQMHAVRPFTLINQENQSFTEQDLTGKVAVVNFFFSSCPGICPKTVRSMMEIQRQFLDDDDVVLLSHSVTPRRDSVPVLQEYAKDKHVNFRRWKLLTGSEQEIYDLGKNFYFLEDDQGIKTSEELFSHTENFVLLDKKRHLRGIYNGLDPSSMEALVRDLRLLLKSS